MLTGSTTLSLPRPWAVFAHLLSIHFPHNLGAWNGLLQNRVKGAHEEEPVACKWDKYLFSKHLSIFHSATKERWLLSQFPTECSSIFLLLTARSPTTSDSFGFPLTRDLCFLTPKYLLSVSKKMLLRHNIQTHRAKKFNNNDNYYYYKLIN